MAARGRREKAREQPGGVLVFVEDKLRRHIREPAENKGGSGPGRLRLRRAEARQENRQHDDQGNEREQLADPHKHDHPQVIIPPRLLQENLRHGQQRQEKGRLLPGAVPQGPALPPQGQWPAVGTEGRYDA